MGLLEGHTQGPGAVGQADGGWAQMGPGGSEAAASETGESRAEPSGFALVPSVCLTVSLIPLLFISLDERGVGE